MTGKIRNRKVDAISPGQPASALSWLGLTQPGSLKLTILLLSILGSGLAVVIMTHQNRSLFNELQQLRSYANDLDVQWGQLLIEQSTFGLEGRVEQKAVEQLKLHVPELDKIIMVTHE